MKDKTDIELLSEVTGLQPDTISECNPSIRSVNVLAALALKEKQMQEKLIEKHAFILMDNLAEIKKLSCSNSDDMKPAIDFFTKLLK